MSRLLMIRLKAEEFRILVVDERDVGIPGRLTPGGSGPGHSLLRTHLDCFCLGSPLSFCSVAPGPFLASRQSPITQYVVA